MATTSTTTMTTQPPTMADISMSSDTASNSTLATDAPVAQRSGGVMRMRIFIGLMVLVMVGFNVRYGEERPLL